MMPKTKTKTVLIRNLGTHFHPDLNCRMLLRSTNEPQYFPISRDSAKSRGLVICPRCKPKEGKHESNLGER